MEKPEIIARSLPHEPGVYLYKDTQGTVIYVGKAKDLNKRVHQYFSRTDSLGIKTQKLVSNIYEIETIKTQNEFDALILESKLIRELNPKYNIIAKDDKSPLYVSISLDEELPRITCIRKSAWVAREKRLLFGPFQSGRTIRSLLRQLRVIAPYCSQKQRNGVPCFYTHIGLCAPCASVLSKQPDSEDRQMKVRTYRRNIVRIADIFSGKSLVVMHELEDEMKRLAAAEQFEEAEHCKRLVLRLRNLLSAKYDPSLYIETDSFVESVYEDEMNALREQLLPYYPHLSAIRRIECIDISNTQGTNATGSLVVLQDGKPETSSYKRFKIRIKNTPNDFLMVREVVRRRLAHTEWEYPDLLVIDGGKGQVSSARIQVLQTAPTLPLVGLAKRFEEIIVPDGNDFVTLRLPVHNKALHMLERIRDESHRFALHYHRLLRKKTFLPPQV